MLSLPIRRQGGKALFWANVLLSGLAVPALADQVNTAQAPVAQAPATQTKILVPQFPIGGVFSRDLQKVTGLNFLAGTIAGAVAKHELRRRLGDGDIKVKIRTFSLTDLIAGKVKSVDVKISRCLIKEYPVCPIELTSAEPLWFDPGFHGHKAGLRRPIMFYVKAKLNQDQVAAAFENPKVAGAIRGLKLDLPGLGAQQINALHPNVTLLDDALKVETLLVTAGAPEETGVRITMSGKPSVQGARIYLRDMQIQSPDIPNPDEFSKFVDELFNPIADLGRYDRKDHAFRIMTLKINPQEMNAEGTLVLAPKPGVKLAQAPAGKQCSLFRHLF